MPGERLLNNRYELGSELGHGGMGSVYRARDRLLDRDVAVKLLSASTLDAAARGRLLHEARAAAQLNHPNIVAVYDAGETDGAPFIVMELLEGCSLHDEPPKELASLIPIVLQICAALEHAHAHGIVHRDLKPENVLVTSGGVAKLMDFGLARSPATRLSAEGAISGTVFYLAPEQALGGAIDGRADLYALGVMLYELAAGRLPFTGDDPISVIAQHLYAPVVPPRAHNPTMPPALETLILQLMCKEPEGRPASAADVGRALHRLVVAPVSGGTGQGRGSGSVPEILSAPEPLLLDRIARGQLVGRGRELGELAAYWERASSGEAQVVLISGEPGVGKTRLARELMALAQVSGGQALLGEAYVDGSAPYAPVGQMIHEGFEKWSRATADLGGEARRLPAAVLADLIALAPALRSNFPDVPPNPPLDASAQQQRMFESVVAWGVQVTARSPLLLVVDDAQWADSGTLALLRHMARRMRRARLMILATYREAELDEALPWHQLLLDLNRERLAVRIKLLRLDREGTRAMLAALFSREITPEFLDAIYRETEGNPFFVEEVCKALVEEGKIYLQDGRWERAEMAEIEIPQSIRMVIQARLGKLPTSAQEALRLAAVLGREFDFDTLLRASDLDEDTLIEGLEAAERAQLIAELQGRREVTFAFAHALIPATLYEGLSRMRRPRLHRRVAEALAALHPDACPALAHHYQEAGDPDQARGYHTKTGDGALAVFAHAEAERAYRAGLDLSPPDEDRAYLLSRLALAIFRQGRYDEAAETGLAAVKLYLALGNVDVAARLYATIARSTWSGGNTTGAVALAQAGLNALQDRPETPGLAYLLHETGRALAFSGHAADGEPLVRRALALAERYDLPEVRSEALSSLSLFPLAIEEKRSALEQAVKVARGAGLPESESRALNNLAELHTATGDMRAAHALYARAAEVAHQAHLPAGELFYLGNTVWMLNELGRLQEAQGFRPVLQELFEQVERAGPAKVSCDELEMFWRLARGDFEGMLELGFHDLAQLRAAGDAHQLVDLDLIVADVLMDRDRLAEAEAALQEAVPIDDEVLGGAQSRCLLAELRARQGRPEEAAALLADARSRAGTRRPGDDEEALARAEARVACMAGNHDLAIAVYERLVSILERQGKRWRRARGLADWAAALQARGQPSDHERARELLETARQEYQEMGSEYWAQEMENGLKEGS